MYNECEDFMSGRHRLTQPDTKDNGVFPSVDSLAEYIGMSRRRTYDFLNNGTIPAIRMGKRFVIPRTAIEKWLQSAGGKFAA